MLKVVALSSIAALAGQALAANPHRHLHQVERRDVVTTWTTTWETVYVTETGTGGQVSVEATSVPVVEEEVTTVASSPTASSQAVLAAVSPTSISVSPSVSPSASPLVSPSTSGALVQTSSSLPFANPTTLVAAVKPSVQLSSSSAESSQASTTSVPPPAQPTTTSQASSAPQPTTTAAASSAPVPTPSTVSTPPTGGAPFSSKRGIAYNDAALAEVMKAACSTCGWAYNWGSGSDGLTGTTFVPQLWGTGESFTSGWTAAAEAAIEAGSPIVFSLNEPDMPSQANVSPQAAAQAQAQYVSPLASKALVGAPAISNSNLAGEGIDWLNQFVTACDATAGCDYSFCVAHWYNDASQVDDLFNQIELVSTACKGKPVVVSEFAPSGTDAEISAFLESALPQLDSNPTVWGYSYFMTSVGILMDSATGLSDYGQVYATST